MLVATSTGPSGSSNPVGDTQSWPFRLSLNKFLRVAFLASWVICDGRRIRVSELHKRFGLTELIGQHTEDHFGAPLSGRPAKQKR